MKAWPKKKNEKKITKSGDRRSYFQRKIAIKIGLLKKKAVEKKDEAHDAIDW